VQSKPTSNARRIPMAAELVGSSKPSPNLPSQLQPVSTVYDRIKFSAHVLHQPINLFAFINAHRLCPCNQNMQSLGIICHNFARRVSENILPILLYEYGTRQAKAPRGKAEFDPW